MRTRDAGRRTRRTRREIVEAIRAMEKRAGRVPRKVEFHAQSRIREHALQRAFSNWGEALKAAGFEPYHKKPLSDEQLLEDWGGVVRKLGRRPKRDEYNKLGRFSPYLLKKSLGSWKRAADLFCSFAKGKAEWNDVVEVLKEKGEEEDVAAKLLGREKVAPSTGVLLGGSRLEPVRLKGAWRRSEKGWKGLGTVGHGDPLDFRRLRTAPVNESGVILLFGMIAAELGLMIEAVQPAFPDCEARYLCEDGKWRRVRIEFEYESRNFVLHGHKPEGCDVIVCWKHNWKECPLQVIELSSIVKQLKAA
ncbi:MAG: hypothetical protein KF691_13645 [Phycisphaeraceae bacterium]|nr:hypothetical protein [Phycisphaeraceae bacterium]